MKSISLLFLLVVNAPANEGDKRFQLANQTYEQAKQEQARNQFSQSAPMFKQAAILFQDFAEKHPTHKDANKARYRSGVARLLVGKRAEAENAFEETIQATKGLGETAASAAFRLGALSYNDDQFKEAIPHFEMAAKETDKVELRYKALNYQVRCLLHENEGQKARELLQRLVDKDNPENEFCEVFKRTLKHLQEHNRESQEALEQMNTSAEKKPSKDPTAGYHSE